METTKFAGVNTNVQIGPVTLHVQTENFPRDLLLITNVYLDGACIHSVKWSYADHVGKAQFEAKLQKAAELQQRNVIKAVPGIWAERNAPKPPPSSGFYPRTLSESVLDHIDRLYLLAMKVRKYSPETAVMIWEEILTLNPDHQLTLQKLSLFNLAAASC